MSEATSMKTLEDLRAAQPAVIKIENNGKITVRPRLTPPTLKEMQVYVGGYVELVPLRNVPNIQCFVNEEGKLHGHANNQIATNLLYAIDPRWIGKDVLVGTVVFLSGKEVQLR